MSSHNGHSPNGVLGRTVLTTGQVARLIGVSPRTVTGWCDSGRLTHYRIPGSQDRRVKRDALEQFIAAHGLPFTVPATGVLLAGHAKAPAGWAGVTCAADLFAAGVAMASWVPALVVVDAQEIGRTATLAVGQAIRSDDRWKRTRLVAVLTDDDGDHDVMRAAGYGEVLQGTAGLCAAREMAAEVLGGTTP